MAKKSMFSGTVGSRMQLFDTIFEYNLQLFDTVIIFRAGARVLQIEY